MKQNLAKVNIPIAIASLAISVMLYFVVLPSWMSRRIRPFTVNLTSVPYGFDSKHFYIDQQPTSIRVHVNVSDQEYAALNESATAEANLSAATPGTRQYPVSLYPDKFRKLVEEADPQATYTLEAVKSRDVPVIVTSVGKLNDPLETLDNMKADTRKATIDGPTSATAAVVHARAILHLDMLDPHSTLQMQVALEPVDASDRVVPNVEIHPAQVMITPKFSVTQQQNQEIEDDIFGDAQVPSGLSVKSYSVLPTHVTASGTSLALSKLAKVSTESIDFSYLTETKTITIALKSAGPDITFSPSSVQVTIIIGPVVLKGLSSQPPQTPPANSTGSAKTSGPPTGR